MDAWKTRIVAAAAALLITGAVILVAELGGFYVTDTARIAAKPAPQEYIINLQSAPTSKPH